MRARTFLASILTAGPAFLITETLVVCLLDQTAQAMADGADRVGMAEARDEPAVHDVEDRSFRLHCGVGGLIDSGGRLLEPSKTASLFETHLAKPWRTFQ